MADECPVLILRAGDFFGGEARSSWFSQALVKPGRPVTPLLNPEPHTPVEIAMCDTRDGLACLGLRTWPAIRQTVDALGQRIVERGNRIEAGK